MYHILMKDLPTTIPGFAKHDPVDDYTTIVLNSRLTHERNIKTYIHEVEHIQGDFDCKEDADTIEKIRHEKSM